MADKQITRKVYCQAHTWQHWFELVTYENDFYACKGETMTPPTTTTTPLLDSLADRWRDSHKLTELYESTMCAFETAFPSAENSGNMSAEQKQSALMRCKALLVESDQAALALLLQGTTLAPAINALTIE